MAVTTKNANEVKNPRLKTYIDMMKEENTPENRRSVIQSIVQGEFIVPIILTPKPDPELMKKGVPLPEGTKMTICLMLNPEGKKFIPAFTDMEEVNKWKIIEGQKIGLTKEQALKSGSGQYTIFDFPQYLRSVLDPKRPLDGMVVNPCGKAVVLTHDMLNDMVVKEPPKTND